MIKLLIVDDEKTIRETIAKLIDWEKLGITLIGSAENGLEALNIILDESPEIVMTDIRMPGLSGLDLIRQIYDLNQDTQFIILSGYDEFEYAKEAMKYGIRHYLLKPCNEEQIIDAILSVKSDIRQKFSADIDSTTAYSLNEGILFNIISKAFTGNSDDLQKIYADYDGFIDLKNIPYTLHYVYYLEHGVFHETIHKIDTELNRAYPGLHCFYIYVENTLLLFYPSISDTNGDIYSILKNTVLPSSGVTPVFDTENYPSLASLLDKIIPRIIRYRIIYFKVVQSIVSLSNSDSLIKRQSPLSDIVSKVIDYVTENLADPYLSLKKISEQMLFMNPDYVSKRFIKETGEKFSQFLTRTRMEYAKKLLAGQHELNVQKAAQETGYGNNPLYFSQLFKKYTSMTPSRYFKKTHPDNLSDI